MRVARLVGLCTLTLMATGCARKLVNTDATSADPGNAELALIIENHHWNDVRIYILHDGVRERLGTVTATSSQSFVIPFRRLGATGTIRLMADPIGGASVLTSESLAVQPGQSITWTLENSLSRSSVMVH
jgi:hypothetical protein